MTASKQIENLYNLVLDLLKADERYRDSDEKLVCRVWTIQLGGYDVLKTYTLYDFLLEYIKPDSFLLSHDSITRARRKVQEEYPALRGEKWAARHKEEDAVIEVIRNVEDKQPTLF